MSIDFQIILPKEILHKIGEHNIGTLQKLSELLDYSTYIELQDKIKLSIELFVSENRESLNKKLNSDIIVEFLKFNRSRGKDSKYYKDNKNLENVEQNKNLFEGFIHEVQGEINSINHQIEENKDNPKKLNVLKAQLDISTDLKVHHLIPIYELYDNMFQLYTKLKNTEDNLKYYIKLVEISDSVIAAAIISCLAINSSLYNKDDVKEFIKQKLVNVNKKKFVEFLLEFDDIILHLSRHMSLLKEEMSEKMPVSNLLIYINPTLETLETSEINWDAIRDFAKTIGSMSSHLSDNSSISEDESPIREDEPPIREFMIKEYISSLYKSFQTLSESLMPNGFDDIITRLQVTLTSNPQLTDIEINNLIDEYLADRARFDLIPPRKVKGGKTKRRKTTKRKTTKRKTSKRRKTKKY